jgi:hypothetical protein
LEEIEYILNSKFAVFLAICPEVNGVLVGLELILIIAGVDGSSYLAGGCFIVIHF